jgi:hypothetical protein
MQWFSLSRLAVMLDFDVSTVRAWWRAGRFGPAPGQERSDYWFTIGAGRGSDVRISVRGYEFFLQELESGRVEIERRPVVVSGRTEGEARRRHREQEKERGSAPK